MTNFATVQSLFINVGTTSTTTTTIGGSRLPQVIPSSQANTFTIDALENRNILSPYIASQSVSFSLTNMRPSTQLYVYFNSVNVTQYCCPGKQVLSTTQWANSIQQIASFGQPIRSDANGHCSGIFNIPPGRFKQGDCILEVCDTNTLSQGNSSFTTIASAPITFGQLAKTKTTTTPITVNPLWSFLPTENSIISSYTDPIAQLFTIPTFSGDVSVGRYLTSVYLYVHTVSNILSNGITIYLCEAPMKNITGLTPDEMTILPFSRVHLNNDQIHADTTGKTATCFSFDAPVYCRQSATYALVIKPDGGDTNYKFHIAKGGAKDTISGTTYTAPSNLTLGKCYLGSTTGWSSTVDGWLKTDIHSAAFPANNTLGNSWGLTLIPTPTDYITALNFVFPNTTFANTINPGDIAFQATSGTVSAGGADITSSANGVVRYWDDKKCVLYVDQSTGGFIDNSCVQIHRFANSSLSTANQSTLVCYANTYQLYDPIADLLTLNASMILPSTGKCRFGMHSSYQANTGGTGASAYTFVSVSGNNFSPESTIGKEVVLTKSILFPSYSHAVAYNAANTRFFIQFTL